MRVFVKPIFQFLSTSFYPTRNCCCCVPCVRSIESLKKRYQHTPTLPRSAPNAFKTLLVRFRNEILQKLLSATFFFLSPAVLLFAPNSTWSTLMAFPQTKLKWPAPGKAKASLRRPRGAGEKEIACGIQGNNRFLAEGKRHLRSYPLSFSRTAPEEARPGKACGEMNSVSDQN